MLHFPQLTTGSVSQYPVSRQSQRRTVTNTLMDGSDLRVEDQPADQVSWHLAYSHLTSNEVAAIQLLFDTVEGRLNTFTFIDPTDNLLKWTEDLGQSVWTTDPLLQASAGLSDPFGLTGAAQLTNTAQTSQRVVQTISAASWYQ